MNSEYQQRFRCLKAAIETFITCDGCSLFLFFILSAVKTACGSSKECIPGSWNGKNIRNWHRNRSRNRRRWRKWGWSRNRNWYRLLDKINGWRWSLYRGWNLNGLLRDLKDACWQCKVIRRQSDTNYKTYIYDSSIGCQSLYKLTNEFVKSSC